MSFKVMVNKLADNSWVATAWIGDSVIYGDKSYTGYSALLSLVDEIKYTGTLTEKAKEILFDT